MHIMFRPMAMLLTLGVAVSVGKAQQPFPTDIPSFPDAGVSLTQADEQGPNAGGNAPADKDPQVIMRGRPIPIDGEWIVNQNSIERYALPADGGFVGFYETPYSTRAEVADVRLVPPTKGNGLANTIILDTKDLLGTADIVLPVLMQGGEKKEIRVELLVVDVVSAAYKTYLSRNIKTMFPTSSIEVIVTNRTSAVVKGYVERAEQVQPIVDMVRGALAATVAQSVDAVSVVNAIRVVGAMQVQLKVTIAEVQRSKVRDLGFEWNWFNPSGNAFVSGVSGATGSFGNRLNGIVGGPNGDFLALGSTTTGNSNVNFILRRNGQTAFEGFLRALQTNNLAKILAEPNLVTTSGQPAYFNVGGQVPVLTPQGNGTIGVTYRDFGTNLRFVPTVLGEGRVRLEVRPEVSELNFGNGVQLGNIIVPGFNVRVAETTVEMENGQSFVIAGLIQKRILANTAKIPLLGEIPIAGALFQNKSYRQDETEIMIMVTPHLVDALDQAPCELPGRESRVPNDIEYYIGSKFEPPCFGDPYKGHIRNWRYNVPSPQPVPVPPYDNYGNPVGTTGYSDGPMTPYNAGPYDAVPIETTPLPTTQEQLAPLDGQPAASAPRLRTGYEVSYGDDARNFSEYPALPETSPVPPPPPIAQMSGEYQMEDPLDDRPATVVPPQQAWKRSSQERWR